MNYSFNVTHFYRHRLYCIRAFTRYLHALQLVMCIHTQYSTSRRRHGSNRNNQNTVRLAEKITQDNCGGTRHGTTTNKCSQSTVVESTAVNGLLPWAAASWSI